MSNKCRILDNGHCECYVRTDRVKPDIRAETDVKDKETKIVLVPSGLEHSFRSNIGGIKEKKPILPIGSIIEVGEPTVPPTTPSLIARYARKLVLLCSPGERSELLGSPYFSYVIGVIDTWIEVTNIFIKVFVVI